MPLTLHHVSHRYQQLTVLELDLTVARGEHLSLLGPSGCGKSTLLRLLAGLEAPSQGEVLLDGEPVRAGDPRLGIMFQDPLLYPWLTVAENIRYPLTLAANRGLPRGRVNELLAKVGLPAFAHSYPPQLSGGMAQRAALARAIVRHPDYLLLDEPFAALDAVTRMRLQSWLEALADSEGLTLVTVTHDVDEAILLGDRVVLMSPAPGRLTRSWQVGLPRPRDRTDARLLALRSEILTALYAVTGDEYGPHHTLAA
ncbi:MAG: ABC transporter ATP-binding protein [Truepera sp.]|nr:ABC transporter ATP-binding protein [Truepera sp.]